MTKQKPPAPADEPQITWGALAAQLGVSLRTLDNYRKRAGAPEDRDEKAWQTFLASHGRGKGAGALTGRAVMQDAKLQQEVRKLQLANDKAERRMIADGQREAQELVTRLMARVRGKLLGQLPGRLADELDGLPRAEREVLARRMIEETCTAARTEGKG